MAERDVLDRAALDHLLETVGGDQSFLAELIDTYVEDAAGLLATMQQSADTGSAEELRRAAHSLKSNSVSFGAATLAELCRELEAMSRDRTLSAASDQVAQAEAEFDKVRQALQAARPPESTTT